jgi:hypothetical protein
MFDRLKQAGNVAKFKADQMIRVQGVQNEIGGINQQLSMVKDRIANTVLELHKRGPLGIPELDEIIGSADALLAQIAQKEAQIAAIKAEAGPQTAPPAPQPGFQQGGYPQQAGGYPPQQGYPPQPVGGFPPPPMPSYPPQEAVATKACPNCHTTLPAAAMFCTTCGYSFQAAPPPVEAAPKTTQICPNCQFEAPATSAFCPNCGHALAH